jgi:hypothetical protein
MKKCIILFFMNIIICNLYSQTEINMKYKITEEEKTSILTKHESYKKLLSEEVDPKVKIAISKCFIENNCKDKVNNLLMTNNIFKNLSQSKKNRLIKSCLEGPKTEHEEFFCRMALSMCGIENPNNCITEKMK